MPFLDWVNKPQAQRSNESPNGRCWLYIENRMREEIAANNIWFGKDGNGVPRTKKFLSEITSGLTPETLWLAEEVGTNDFAKKHLIELFRDTSLFDTPKPESLISRVLHIATNPGDLVLDSFLGSGTTAAVAHKMGRRYIGIEMGEHAKTHCLPRLEKVIAGEQGGISEAVGWKGGGGFRFHTLGEPVSMPMVAFTLRCVLPRWRPICGISRPGRQRGRPSIRPSWACMMARLTICCTTAFWATADQRGVMC